MLIKRTSMLSGIERTKDIDVTQEQLDRYYSDRNLMIQDAFPHLSATDREFIKTGITDPEWDETFKPEDEG